MPIKLLLLAAFVIYLILALLSAFSWKAMSVSSPDYAKELFTPGIDQVFYRLGPLRWRILFGRRAPEGLRRWVIALRIVVVVQICTAAAFIFSLVRPLVVQ
jgi:hypothetical protein